MWDPINLHPDRQGKLITLRGTGDENSSRLTQLLNVAHDSRFAKNQPLLFVAHPQNADVSFGRHRPNLVTDSAVDIWHTMQERTAAVLVSGAAYFEKRTDGRGLLDLFDSLVRSNRLVVAEGEGFDGQKKINGIMPDLLSLSDEIRVSQEPNGLYIVTDVGCMFSGKTTLTDKSHRSDISKGLSSVVFNHLGDIQRYGAEQAELFGTGKMTSHPGALDTQGVYVETAQQISEYLQSLDDVPFSVYVNEGQFFDDLRKVASICKKLGVKHLGVNGLIRGFNRGKFGTIPELMVEADGVRYARATCETCGSPARDSQRLKYVNEETCTGNVIPAHVDDPLKAVGGSTEGNKKSPFFYEARCLDHWLLGGEQPTQFPLSRYRV